MQYDLLIKGGLIADGSGGTSYAGDIGILDGRLHAVGRASGSAREVINADGLMVAPGFIDHHTHLDAQLLWDPLASSSCWHGVTTVVTGNCSLSLAPCKPEHRGDLISCFARVEAISRKALEAGIEWQWESFGDYLRTLEHQRGVNVACLIGHNAVRQYVMGSDATERAATPEEIAGMRRIVKQAMHDGAAGLSLNQSKHHFREDGKPIPATVADKHELLELAAVLRECGHGYVQVNGGSMGSEVSPADNYKFLRELAQACRRPILFNLISHKWQTPHIWKEALELGAECLAQGYRIHGTTSTLPTTFQFNLLNVQVLFDRMPSWAPLMFVTREERMKGFADPVLRPKLRYEACEDPSAKGFHKRWDLVTIQEVRLPQNRKWERKTVAELAAAQGKHPVDAFLDLALSEDLKTEFKTIIGNGDKDAVGQMLNHPATIAGTSDAGAHTSFLADYGYCTELVGPWVRDRGLMSIERAVHLLTMVPASILGLPDRGQLRPGYMADLVLFDPTKVGPCEPTTASDYPAGEMRQVQEARGIHATIINGKIFVRDGKHTGALPGQVLRHAPAAT